MVRHTGAPGITGVPMLKSLRALALVFVASFGVLGAVVGSAGAIARFGSDGYEVPVMVGP
jgi:hypothetical protein